MIALLAALQEEVSALWRRLKLTPARVAGFHNFIATGEYQGRAVLLTCTGMGRQRAEVNASAMLERYPVTVALSIGFSGALEGTQRVGDLVLASELLAVTGSLGCEPASYPPDPMRLLTITAALRETSLRVRTGPTVTTPGVIPTPEEKEALGKQTGAIAVDMESYWIARIAAERGLPFLALRVISDAQADGLLPFEHLADANGASRARWLMAHLLREPGGLAMLLKLGRHAREARRTLAAGAACAVAAL
ncbi:MAG TPA: hypothetical protein PLQ85_03770 [Anaerolineae bacterium]|nr:MAG: 5'-methylthioadenosine/S-adenosylhomocysteine nucleosidase [Chloroflexi bacterium ADurb.Bin222]HOS78809.1 hypothetical protein [Anaerolineae bacterium]HQE98458.1 hypothetical protein [Anaerolineae bacterium]HUM35971.1 hypothetical protein [Anaerolineae bacterium]